MGGEDKLRCAPQTLKQNAPTEHVGQLHTHFRKQQRVRPMSSTRRSAASTASRHRAAQPVAPPLSPPSPSPCSSGLRWETIVFADEEPDGHEPAIVPVQRTLSAAPTHHEETGVGDHVHSQSSGDNDLFAEW